MPKYLVVVESPAKTKKIESFLGSDYTVQASFGHIRDLDPKNLSIDIENNFKPHYIINDDKKKVVQKRELYGDDVSDTGIDVIIDDGGISDESTINENIVETTDNTPTIETEMSAEEEKARLDEMGEPLVRATIQKSIIDKRPYYEHPAFDWSLKKYWINDQSAVKYWMNNVKGKEKSKYPTNFDSKTY